MPEEVSFSGFEYRKQGGEIHRRPANRERLSSWDSAWMVLNHQYDFIPEVVQKHFKQAQDLGAIE